MTACATGVAKAAAPAEEDELAPAPDAVEAALEVIGIEPEALEEIACSLLSVADTAEPFVHTDGASELPVTKLTVAHCGY